MTNRDPNTQSLFYKCFRHYVKFVTENLYYRKVYVLGTDNLPAPDKPTILVSNHQNCLSDPLALATFMMDRKPRFLARANVFKQPVIDKLLRHLGLLPAYRMEYEGKQALEQNFKTFDQAIDTMLHGGTVILYPERGHQNKRWLGNFFVGYLKMGFHAAELTDFKQEILILPSCNHYSNYHHMQSEVLIKFGEPVSLAPYYDSYRQNPRKTMREVNRIVRERVSELMLNIEDIDNYEAIDFLRENGYGKHFASHNGFEKDCLPEKLDADKSLIARLKEAKERYPERMQKIFEECQTLQKGINDMKIRDWIFDRKPSLFYVVLYTLMLLVLLPLFVVCMVPNLLLFVIPEYFKSRLLKDRMFFSSFNIGVSVLITIPLLYIVPFIVLCCKAKFVAAVLYLVFCPLALLFSWYYMRWTSRCMGMIRYRAMKNSARFGRLRTLRHKLFASLDELLGIRDSSL